jgi:hypothetical protein
MRQKHLINRNATTEANERMLLALFIYSNLFAMSSPNTQGQAAASGIVPYNPTKLAGTRLSTKKQ